MNTIDPRLVVIYNEYLQEEKEADFLMMLYKILDMATADVKDSVARKHRYDKMKATKAERMAVKKEIEAFFNRMSVEERIKFLNTPWEEQPEWIKENFKSFVRFPEEFNFLRVAGIVSKEMRQKETFGARLIRYMENHGFITGTEEGTKLHFENFAQVCNTLAENYDLPYRPGHKAQRTRITTSDLQGYTTKNITPKKDKLTVISAATGIPIAYFGGYMDEEPPTIGIDPTNPFAPIGGKFRKKRKTAGDVA